mgnify:CR=1 FL=1
MGFFNDMKDRAVDLAQAGVAQSKRLAEIAKLKTANLGEEDTIKKAYIELGKLYYAEKGAAPDGAYVAACERIDAARAAIETNNDRIAELKAVIGEGKTGDDTVIVDDGPIVDGPAVQPAEEATQADFAEEEPAAPEQPEEAAKTEELACAAQPETAISPGWAVFCRLDWKKRKAGPGIAS